jgi:phosphatidate cytidylyltransferase
LWLPHECTAVVFALLVLAGAWEWSAFPGFSHYRTRIAYVVLIALGVIVMGWVGAARQYLDEVLIAACLWWLVALLWIAYFPTRVSRWSAAAAGVFVLIPAWLALVRLHSIAPQLVVFLVLLVVAADVGAYFGGRQFGQHKLAPRVSPGKTWEGVAGGLVAAGLMAAVGVYWFNVRAAPFTLLCGIVIVASIVGDLTESLFKRHAGLKDSGSLLPGHGGVLDRVDSLTAAAPIFLVALERLGLFR